MVGVMRVLIPILLITTGCGEGYAYFSCPSVYYKEVVNYAPIDSCEAIDHNTELAIRILSGYGYADANEIRQYLAGTVLKLRGNYWPWPTASQGMVNGLFFPYDLNLPDDSSSIELELTMFSLAHEILHMIEWQQNRKIDHEGWEVYQNALREFEQGVEFLPLPEGEPNPFDGGPLVNPNL